MISTAPSHGRNCAALAGRRIDELDAKIVRFPIGCIEAVRSAIVDTLQRAEIELLVCSAACGADLLALDAASSIGIRCRIVLPYNLSDFRATSVVDRPGDWGGMYDRALRTVSKEDLLVLNGVVGESNSFRLANQVIISEALELAAPRQALAIVVWEGQPRHCDDLTAEFRQLAHAAGMNERTITTWPI